MIKLERRAFLGMLVGAAAGRKLLTVAPPRPADLMFHKDAFIMGSINLPPIEFSSADLALGPDDFMKLIREACRRARTFDAI